MQEKEKETFSLVIVEEFEKLGICKPVLQAIEEEGFVKASLIQKKAIPLILEGKDIIGASATGSGKTLVFASGIIQNAERGRGIQALILTPTRELSEQIAKTFRMFSKYKPLTVVSIVGGLSINPQIQALQSADVVVGTPGRLLDHIERQTIRLSEVRTLVLDEADRMLDMGFIDDVERIIRQCPEKRQTLLFGATVTGEVARLAQKYLRSPVHVTAEKTVDPSKMQQVYYDITDKEKFSLLVHLLRQEHTGLVMVFCNTRENTDFVARNLSLEGINATAIHGGLSQEKRNQVMRHFHSEKVTVLVCTDVAARGLDIRGVSHVYNYDIPKESKEYIHRIGRTARAGEKGLAINIVAVRDRDNFTRVLHDNNIYMDSKEIPHFRRIRIQWIPERRRFRRGPERKGFKRPVRTHRGY